MSEGYDWREGAKHDYLNTDMSLNDIAQKYGRDASTVAKYVRREGLQRTVRSKGGMIPYDQQPVVSPQHKSIGIRLNLYRTVTLKESPTEFSNRLMTNRYVIRQMELGLHDFTLTEMNRISQLLGVTPTELLAIKKEPYAG